METKSKVYERREKRQIAFWVTEEEEKILREVARMLRRTMSNTIIELLFEKYEELEKGK